MSTFVLALFLFPSVSLLFLLPCTCSGLPASPPFSLPFFSSCQLPSWSGELYCMDQPFLGPAGRPVVFSASCLIPRAALFSPPPQAPSPVSADLGLSNQVGLEGWMGPPFYWVDRRKELPCGNKCLPSPEAKHWVCPLTPLEKVVFCRYSWVGADLCNPGFLFCKWRVGEPFSRPCLVYKWISSSTLHGLRSDEQSLLSGSYEEEKYTP